MELISLLLVWLLGVVVLHSISSQFTFLEKTGMAFPVGIGLTTMMMFVLNLLGLPLNESFVPLGGIMTIMAALIFANPHQFRDMKQVFSFHAFKRSAVRRPGAAEIFLMICIAAIALMVIIKGTYWIVFIYDSIAGYDFYGRSIAYEGTLHTTLFNPGHPLYTVRYLYPPLIPLAFSFVYVTGGASSQVVIALFFASFLFSFYALLCRNNSALCALLFTILLVTAPQFTSFSSLSSSSMPCAFYCSMGMICLFIWWKEQDTTWFICGTLLLTLAMWTRSEAVAFAIAGALMILIRSLRKKLMMPVGIYLACTAAAFFSWQFYLSHVLQVAQAQPVIHHLYFDGGKLKRMLSLIAESIFRVDLFGIVVYLFLLVLLLSMITGKKGSRLRMESGIILLSWLLMAGIFYQLNVSYQDSNSITYITSGFVRVMFSFLPLMLYDAANSLPVTQCFSAIETWRNDNGQTVSEEV